MAWIFNDGTGTTVNITGASTAALVFRLKALLKLAGWVIQASSDGTNVSNTPGNANDQITTDTEMGTNHAWFVIAQPAIPRGIGYPGNRQIIIRRGTSDTTWLIAYVPANTDGTIQASTANGTTAAIPTYATTQIQVGTLPDTTATWSGHTSRRITIAAENAAPYCWFFLTWPTGGGAPDAGALLLFDVVKPGTYDPLDIDPAVLYMTENSGVSLTQTGGATCLGSSSSSGTSHGPKAYVRRGMSGETYTVHGLAAYAVQDGSTLVVAVPAGVGRNVYGSAKELPLPAYYITGGITSGTAGGDVGGQPASVKGESYLMSWRMGGYPIGTMLTRHTPGDRCVYGDVTLPHDGSTVLTVTA